MTDRAETLRGLLVADSWRMNCLRHLRAVMGSEAWIAAGFLRNLVWDRLQGLAPRPLDDVDVVYFDATAPNEAQDKAWETALQQAAPGVPWSVKNQARMHLRNADTPYRDLKDALAHWLETATGVAARLDDADRPVFMSAHGMEDLLGFTLRPTASGLARLDQLRARMKAKGWLERWPGVRLVGFDNLDAKRGPAIKRDPISNAGQIGPDQNR